MTERTSLPDLAARGPHHVGVRTVEIDDADNAGRRLPIDVWYPAQDGVEERAEHPFGQVHRAAPDAPPASGSFPLVAFSHGNSGLSRQSTFLTTHLASHGFVVTAPDHTGNTFFEMLELDEQQRKAVHFAARKTRPRDLGAAIDVALAGAPGIDPGRIYALGHSYGGWTAFKMPAADERVRAVCGLAPASEPFVGRKAFAPGELPLAVPSLIVAGIEDVLVDLETSVRPLAERMAAPTRLLGIEATDHFHFCDGVPLLHGIHEKNVRRDQPRPTKPLAELLPEQRIQRILCGVVTAFFVSVEDAGPDPRDLADFDRAIRVLA